MRAVLVALALCASGAAQAESCDVNGDPRSSCGYDEPGDNPAWIDLSNAYAHFLDAMDGTPPACFYWDDETRTFVGPDTERGKVLLIQGKECLLEDYY